MPAHCRACDADLAHCHGTLITHALHRPECTAGDCVDETVILHAWVLDCDTVGCECSRPMALAG